MVFHGNTIESWYCMEISADYHMNFPWRVVLTLVYHWIPMEIAWLPWFSMEYHRVHGVL